MSREYNKKIMKIRIEQVALELLEEKSYKPISMDEIAARSDITKRTLYQYFPSKGTLFASLFENYLKSLYDEITKVFNENKPSSLKIINGIKTFFKFSNETPIYMRLFRIIDIIELNDELPVELSQRLSIWNNAIRDQFVMALREKELYGAMSAYSPELITHLIVAVNKGIFFETSKDLQMVNTSEVNPQNLQDMFIDLMESAVGLQKNK